MSDTSTRAARLPATITVPANLNGPAGSANGGVAAGLLGELLGGTVRVRLYRPPPLGRAMQVRETANGIEALYEGEVALAAAPARVDVHPPPVTTEEAAAATAPFVGHAAVTCIVCGPDSVDGLHLFPGPVGAGPIHATVWTPPMWAGDGRGFVRPEIVWGALDCPGAIMLVRHYPGESMFPALGTITAEISEPIRVGDSYAVVAWPRGRDGRKLFAGTAIVGAGGRVHARSDQVCIAMPFEWGGIA
jgi:hypothetical protein